MTSIRSSKSVSRWGIALVSVSLFLVTAGAGLLETAKVPPPELALTLIPLSPVTDQGVIDVRAAVRNCGSAAGTFEVSFYGCGEVRTVIAPREGRSAAGQRKRSSLPVADNEAGWRTPIPCELWSH